MKKKRTFYEYNPDPDTYSSIIFDSSVHKEIFEIHYSDEPLLPTWKPKRCRVYTMPQSGDFPTLIDHFRIPVMSTRAWTALRPLIGYCSEALPIIHPSGEEYFLIHVMNTIDALDVDVSEVSRTGEKIPLIQRVYRYAFHEEKLVGQPLFKLPFESGSDMIVDDEFRKVVEANRLRGLKFKELPRAR